ncbi:putative NAD dependent epimerase dehydratase family NAD(P)H binding [Trypanosoma vivax]|uniref:NAD-dependent epimerase/dehydratase domain-containing protein n=1 Tax=Trypanosoma vivax (strain Y486) TaxID=1055687 RepID=G0TYR9_TRYVY|nr:putative NAD dependent epimerase dehydratase family NAD(P)H binding [Trypanosoma vivax]CCC49118.1 conserved hypothetical protein [Trypanosoma vivax Y486]
MCARKLLVFGGTGFIGSAVIKRALRRGWHVVCGTRGGLPASGSPLSIELERLKVAKQRSSVEAEGLEVLDFESSLEFITIDATSRSQVAQFLEDQADASAIVSCVGKLTRDHDEARRVCGDANANIAAVLYESNHAARRFVLVSAEPPNPFNNVLCHRWVLKGYLLGKKIAERAVLENLGARGVVLRPGFVYGSRYVPLGGSGISIPLWLLGKPLETVLRPLGKHGILVPPVNVDVVAEAALQAAEGSTASGILNYYDMQELWSRSKLSKVGDKQMDDYRSKVLQKEDPANSKSKE